MRQRGESLHKTASLRQGEETVKCEETLQEPCCVDLYLLGACICVIYVTVLSPIAGIALQMIQEVMFEKEETSRRGH